MKAKTIANNTSIAEDRNVLVFVCRGELVERVRERSSVVPQPRRLNRLRLLEADLRLLTDMSILAKIDNTGRQAFLDFASASLCSCCASCFPTLFLAISAWHNEACELKYPYSSS